MAKKMTKTEQGRAKRVAEKAARAAATQARRDSAAAAQERSEQRNDGGTSERMSQREAAAGLNLAGNDPLAGRKSLDRPMPTMSEREAAAGLNLVGNNPMPGTDFGQDSFYDSDIKDSDPESPTSDVMYPENNASDAGAAVAGDGGGDGGTFTLDVVKGDNTAGTATFNGSGVN